MAQKKEIKLKVLLMDDIAEVLFEEGGLQGVKDGAKRGNLSFKVVEKTFNTVQEMRAYIDGLYDVTLDGYTTYAILEK